MKKTVVLIVVLAIVQLACISLWSISETNTKPFTIGTRNANSMDVQFKVPDYEIEREFSSGQTWDKIKVAESGFLFEKGMPELPILTTTIAIPNHGQVEVELINTHTRMVEHILPYPSQEGTLDTANQELYVNKAFYEGSTGYPQSVIQCSEPQILRDFRIITIQIQPFAWNASTHELEVRDQVDIRLHFTETRGINELDGPLMISSSFEHIYASTILNFDDYRGYLLANTPPRYLIIYGATTDATFLSKVTDFVFWKKQKGADVRLVSTAVAGSSTTAIKTFIQNNYNDINTRPDYVVFIGDVTGSFSIPTYTEAFSGLSGHGDYPYTHLAGNDLLGDVFIGRISVESTSQLDIMLSKVYFYEKNLNINTAQWLNRILLAGNSGSSGWGLRYVMKNIKDMSFYYNPDYTYIEQYPPSSSSMDSGINQGVGFFWYRGYIGMDGWSPSGSLINGTKLPHAIIITCGTGNFSYGESTTEAFVRSVGTAAVPAGAVTAIGMETSHTNPMCNNILERGMAAGIFANGMRSMGEALLNGKLLCSAMYGQNHTLVANYSNHWCNLIGDPTMEVWPGIPGTFTLNAPDSLPNGVTYLDLTIADADTEPVQGACVTVSQSNIIMARGYTDASGRVYLFLNTPLSTGGAVVTVSKHEFKPLQKNMLITAGGSLVSSQALIDDDNIGASTGNGNFTANSGETLEILFSVRNTTLNPIANVTGTVTSSSQYVNITGAALNFLTIDAGAANYSIVPGVVHVLPGCPNNTVLRFDLVLTDSTGLTYEFLSLITVTDAFLSFISSEVQDGGNQVLDPNESAGLSITLKNNGSVPASNLYGQLVTQNDLVLIQDNTGFFGDFLVGQQVSTVADTFRIMGRAQMLPGMQIPLRLRLYNAAGFLQWLDFTLTVGTSASTNPLGPDAHGYVIYDITDTSYEDCPAYQWVGIAPAEGGQGSVLGFSDSSVDEDGDAENSVTTIPAILPFQFVFYGQPYTQITVSSNGFIAMGTTENGNWANCPIPGWGGPAPMIAPFWDDLITGTGGVYKWYDTTNHCFIVEWYNLKNGFNQSSLETFEVILYDPVYYPTSLGDGPIKIQYNTFNNVDYVWQPNNLSSVYGTGNYATIGIQNADLSAGLQYSFNNLYPTQAAPLANQKALYITNVPVYHYTPHLLYDSAYVRDNNNNVLEPNETVDLYVNLVNIGEQPAQGINTTITSTSSYVNIIDNNSVYPQIAQDSTGANLTPFRVFISADCVDNQVLPFTINITSDTNFWQRSFNLVVEKPSLGYDSYMINDVTGNNNGVADPGETVTLVINAKNTSTVETHNLTGTLSTVMPGITVLNPVINKPIIGGGEIIQLNYTVQVDSTITPGGNVTFSFNLTSSDAPVVNQNVTVPFATSGMVLDMESTDGYFEPVSGWVYGTPNQTTPHSGSHVWATNLMGTYADNANFVLRTPSITLGENASLSFWHMLGCQNYYDGGNVSISPDGGSTWILLYPVGGYNTSFSIYSLGEYGYTNSIGWSQATFNLSNYANQSVLLRWRFASNGSVASTGWFIDDVMVSNYYITPGIATGTVAIHSTDSPALAKVETNNHITTNPDSTGVYTVYLPRGNYTLTASMPYHISQESASFTLSGGQLVYNYDFDLVFMANPTALGYTLAEHDSVVYLNWTAPETVLPVLNYNVYRRLGEEPYQVMAQPATNSYSETLHEGGTYTYYVTAVYEMGEGVASAPLEVIYTTTSNPGDEAPVWVNALKSNYPNPFNPVTTITFSLAKSGNVSLKIYNTKGQLVRTLAQAPQKAGLHQLVWNGRDDAGKTVSSGLYFYRMDAPGYTKTRKMMMLK